MISFLFLAALLTAGSEALRSLEIDVLGIATAEGQIAWSLYDSAATYDGDGEPLHKGRSDIAKDLSSRIVIADLAPAEYGVRLYHDENGNGELDRGRMRRPKEPYGFSNNARGRFGPAAWEAVRFTIGGEDATEPLRIEIEVR